MSHLRLQGLRKSYGGPAAVADVHLDVAAGECIALLGPSGCGKTTTLRLVAGFITPDAGTIHLDGEDIGRLPPHRRNIGMVFQNYALFPHMTAAGNVAFGLEMRGIGREERRARVAEALEMVGLAGFAQRYPAQLSGGQQQRVALARALVTRPALLLLDEPLSNLDAGLRIEMRQEIARLRRALNITTLFVTHDQEEALALADRIVVMHQGRVVEIGTPQQLSEAPAHLFTASFLGARTVLPVAQAAALGLAIPAGATHAVLRAARLELGVEGAAGHIAEAAWLGDAVHYEWQGAQARIRVLRPTTEAVFAPGQPAALRAPANAITWIGEPA